MEVWLIGVAMAALIFWAAEEFFKHGEYIPALIVGVILLAAYFFRP